MIIKAKKILIYGIQKQLDVFFKAAQEKGFLEFIKPKRKIKKVSDNVKDYIGAIKILKKQPVQLQKDAKGPSYDMVKKILDLNKSLEKLFEEDRMISLEIMRVLPFGDFSKKDLKSLENDLHRYFQFFTIKRSERKVRKISDELIYINSAYDLDYFISFNKERKTYPKMIEIFIDEPLSLLREKKASIEKQIDEIQKEIKQLAKYYKYLINELIKEVNISSLESAKSDAFHHIEESIFAIDAWVPMNKINELKLLVKKLNVSFVEIAIEKKDRQPTYLENKKAKKIGEDIIKIYDIPNIEDKDPSLWVLVFFSLFFAMIVSDAGYGFVYLAIGFVLKYFLKKAKPSMNRFIKLVFILCTTTILWGFFIGGFFGFESRPSSFLHQYTPLNRLVEKKAQYHMQKKDDVYQEWLKKYPVIATAKSPHEFLLKIIRKEENQLKFLAFGVFKNNILMELSLLVGITHISLSLLRYIKRNLAAIGWVFFILGGYLFFPSILQATSLIHFLNILDKQSCFFIGKIFLFSSVPIAIILAFIQKKLMGFLEFTNLISIFADIMSYIRLYALGLAGSLLADAFNDLGISLGLPLGFVIIALGHLVNLPVSLVGGVIHGLRLNFIEWYHYSFEGDGKLFNPLKLLK